jgi:hypothetical protein
VTTATAAALSRHVLASDPLLRWDAIAAHARDHHGHTWPTEKAAVTAITGGFDAIVPNDFMYSPEQGTISSPPLPAPPARAPAWTDAQALNCTIAVLAANAAECDLQEIYGEINIPARHYEMLDTVSRWHDRLDVAQRALAKPRADRVPYDFGDLTWLRHLDDEDLATFIAELRTAVSVACHEDDLAKLEQLARDWRATADELADPARRHVLLGDFAAGDFAEAERPGNPG